MNRVGHHRHKYVWLGVALVVGVVGLFVPRWLLPTLIGAEALLIGRVEWHRGWLARDADHGSPRDAP